MEPVWSESAVHSIGATILDPKASSTASEPIKASEAGEPMGTEQVESAVSCAMASSVAGDIAEARAEVKSRIETSAAGASWLKRELQAVRPRRALQVLRT